MVKMSYNKNALNLPTNAFEFVDKRGDFLQNVLFPGQVLWVERTHLRQDRIQFRAVVTGKFAFDRIADVALCGFNVDIFRTNKFFCFTFSREGVESLYHARLVTKFIKIRLIDEINQAEPVRVAEPAEANSSVFSSTGLGNDRLREL